MSDDLTRPGPTSIGAGEAVGGLVVHVYSVPDCELLHVGKLNGFLSDEDVERVILDDVTAAAAAVADHRQVCLVMYDGDSGERLSHWPDPWN